MIVSDCSSDFYFNNKRRAFTIGDLYDVLGDKVSILYQCLLLYWAFYLATKDSL